MTAPAGHFNKLYDPLFLYAQTIVSPGGSAGPNTTALMNPHGLPMELLEVRWWIYPNSDETDQFEEITGMGVGVKMDMGDIPIVDADVPVNGFGTARDDSDRSSSGQTVIWPNPNDENVTVNPYSYRWRLKYPLLVPAGCVVTPVYSHLGQNHFPVTVHTIYVCRSMPAGYTAPSWLWAPWAGSYNSVSFDNLASQPAGRDFSSELDIVNPFRQPLELARIAGRCTAITTDSGTLVQRNLETSNDFRFKLGKVRIRSRSGDEIARSPTPFNGLFPYGWRVWDVPGGWTLRPGEFYKVQLTVDPTNATAPSTSTQGSIQYAINAIGYRKLRTNVFLQAAGAEVEKGDAL